MCVGVRDSEGGWGGGGRCEWCAGRLRLSVGMVRRLCRLTPCSCVHNGDGRRRRQKDAVEACVAQNDFIAAGSAHPDYG